MLRHTYNISSFGDREHPAAELRGNLFDYKALTSAEKNSITALNIAIIGIFLAAIGIFFQLKQTKLTEMQSISERIKQARAVTAAKDFCKQNPDAKEAGLFEVATGEPVPCSEVMRYGQ